MIYIYNYTLNSLSIKPYRWWIKKIPCRYASSTLRLGLRRPGQRRMGKLDSVWIRRSWMSTSSWANSMGNPPVVPQICFDNGLTSTCVDMPRQLRLFSLFLWYYGCDCIVYHILHSQVIAREEKHIWFCNRDSQVPARGIGSLGEDHQRGAKGLRMTVLEYGCWQKNGAGSKPCNTYVEPILPYPD